MAKALLCAVALMSGDLLLDPLCVAAGLWRWDGGGASHGVPLTNFSGWTAVGFSIYLPLVTRHLSRLLGLHDECGFLVQADPLSRRRGVSGLLHTPPAARTRRPARVGAGNQGVRFGGARFLLEK